MKGAGFKRRLDRPTPELQSIVRRLRVHLGTSPSSALALVEIESAEPAALAITALARLLASEGQRVLLADAARGRPLRALVRGKKSVGSLRMVPIGGQSVGLVVAPAEPGVLAHLASDEEADVHLILATVDPAFGTDHLATWAHDAVVMVRSGKATRPQIDGVARQLRQAGITVRAGMLVGTDPDDHTAGVSATPAMSPDHAEHLLETPRASGQ